jgi:hypothetical protein
MPSASASTANTGCNQSSRAPCPTSRSRSSQRCEISSKATCRAGSRCSARSQPVIQSSPRIGRRNATGAVSASSIMAARPCPVARPSVAFPNSTAELLPVHRSDPPHRPYQYGGSATARLARSAFTPPIGRPGWWGERWFRTRQRRGISASLAGSRGDAARRIHGTARRQHRQRRAAVHSAKP